MPTCCLAEEGIDRAPAHRVEAFRTIQRNGEHLLQVINDILDLSKVEAGKLSLELIRCSPGEVLLDVQRIVKQPAEAKNLPFQIEFRGSRARDDRDRSHAAAAGAGESDRQRDQVHRARER